jgi:hypothetical protein
VILGSGEVLRSNVSFQKKGKVRCRMQRMGGGEEAFEISDTLCALFHAYLYPLV